MARISPEELWKLVVKTGLCDRSAAVALRAECDARPAGARADARDVATWLADRGVLTRWQARRLGAGDDGPFFYGEYRLLERHDREPDVFEFTARHDPSRRLVTLVLLGRRQWRDPAIRAAIVRRTTIAVGMTDPMLVRTWALEEADGRPFVVCEEVRGESLADELARRGPLPLPEAGTIALASTRAVAQLHAAGEVHGGLALDTLIREPVVAGGRLRLRQFPLAGDPHRVPPRPSMATAEELSFLGRRAAFVAPELVRGAACDARSDVYALGCILHALVTGTAPNWRSDARDTLDRAAAGPGPLDSRVAPAPLATLVGCMTAHDPDDRYQDAVEAARAIAVTFGFAQPELPVPQPGPAAAGFTFAPPAAGPTGGPSLRPSDPAAARAAATEAARRRGRRLRLVGVGLAAGILGVAAATVTVRAIPPPRRLPPVGKVDVAARGPSGPDARTSREPPADAGSTADRRPSAPVPATAGPTIVDDETLPWVSPTAGPPPAFDHVPEGSQLLVAVRPAALLADEEGHKFLRALGPAVNGALDTVANACGCTPAEIETLEAGWQIAENDEIVVGWSARLVAGAGPPGDGDAGKPAAGRVLVGAPGARSAEIVEPPAEAGSAPTRIVLPVDMERLADALDGSRHLTILGSRAFLIGGGRELFPAALEPLVPEIDALLAECVQAVAVSVHCGTDFYVELDAVTTVEEPAATCARRVADRIARYPAAVRAFRDARTFDEYGRPLVLELPTMVGLLAANVRVGAENKLAIVNACLPRHAGHNILLAADLALAQMDAVGTAAPAPEPPRDARARLAQRTTLVVEKEPLENVIKMISDDIGVPIEIRGKDFELEGITRVQKIDLDQRDKPAEAILRVILAKANTQGKLVYVVRQQDGKESIEITTRAAAQQRGDPLPPAFQEAGTPAMDKP